MSRKNNRKHDRGLSWNLLKAEWQSWYSGKSPVLKFVLQFGLLVVLLYVLLAIPFCDRLLQSYLVATAWLSNVILNAMGQDTQVSEVTIRSSQFAIVIHRGCDAVEPTWLLCAAVSCFPVPLMRKVVGMLGGIVLLQLLNLVRIVTLYWIGIHCPAFFNSAHMEIWPTAFIIVAIMLFTVWKGWALDAPEPHTV